MLRQDCPMRSHACPATTDAHSGNAPKAGVRCQPQANVIIEAPVMMPKDIKSLFRCPCCKSRQWGGAPPKQQMTTCGCLVGTGSSFRTPCSLPICLMFIELPMGLTQQWLVCAGFKQPQLCHMLLCDPKIFASIVVTRVNFCKARDSIIYCRIQSAQP